MTLLNLEEVLWSFIGPTISVLVVLALVLILNEALRAAAWLHGRLHRD